MFEVIDFETRFEFGKADRADEKEAALTREYLDLTLLV